MKQGGKTAPIENRIRTRLQHNYESKST